MSITNTKKDNAIVLNTTLKQHSNEIACLGNELDELLARIEPVCQPPACTLDYADPTPATNLCGVAQLIYKETQHVRNMLAQVTRTLALLQLPEADVPEGSDPVCRS